MLLFFSFLCVSGLLIRSSRCRLLDVRCVVSLFDLLEVPPLLSRVTRSILPHWDWRQECELREGSLTSNVSLGPWGLSSHLGGMDSVTRTRARVSPPHLISSCRRLRIYFGWAARGQSPVQNRGTVVLPTERDGPKYRDLVSLRQSFFRIRMTRRIPRSPSPNPLRLGTCILPPTRFFPHSSV